MPNALMFLEHLHSRLKDKYICPSSRCALTDIKLRLVFQFWLSSKSATQRQHGSKQPIKVDAIQFGVGDACSTPTIQRRMECLIICDWLNEHTTGLNPENVKPLKLLKM